MNHQLVQFLFDISL